MSANRLGVGTLLSNLGLSDVLTCSGSTYTPLSQRGSQARRRIRRCSPATFATQQNDLTGIDDEDLETIVRPPQQSAQARLHRMRVCRPPR